ncbi:hypothetical protein G4B88_013214 [Cannabis sativa]|uniref:Uncharacterized protein n=1 Tax=Cannabis sativa TaxID=3483 RepID=A0A7J6GZL4_CANSA|nr:hypothetical protein G4B88_013214 [Cannabis sativa]
MAEEQPNLGTIEEMENERALGVSGFLVVHLGRGLRPLTADDEILSEITIILKISSPLNISIALEGIDSRVSNSNKAMISEVFSETEFQKAFFKLPLDKAPRVDVPFVGVQGEFSHLSVHSFANLVHAKQLIGLSQARNTFLKILLVIENGSKKQNQVRKRYYITLLLLLSNVDCKVAFRNSFGLQSSFFNSRKRSLESLLALNKTRQSKCHDDMYFLERLLNQAEEEFGFDHPMGALTIHVVLLSLLDIV